MLYSINRLVGLTAMSSFETEWSFIQTDISGRQTEEFAEGVGQLELSIIRTVMLWLLREWIT